MKVSYYDIIFLVIIMNEAYKKLAERNGWSYSESDNKPYFMKDGSYAIPDETTTDEDKELLANIISEGSSEMAQLILLCWNNGITISGPCSGIREFHDKPPISLHFSFKASKEIIDLLFNSLQSTLSTFHHMYRESNGLVRYDIDYFLEEKELSAKESNDIFAVIKNQLQNSLDIIDNKKTPAIS